MLAMGKFKSSDIAAGEFLSFKDATGQNVYAKITGVNENSQQITAIVCDAASTVQASGVISVGLETGDVLHGGD
jgi:hypothetical protein